MKKLIDVYPYRIKDGYPEFLLLKRSSEKIYAGQWRMIGGKVKEGEASWEAALRELREETTVKPGTFWVIPSVNQFYEAKSDTIHHIPAFAAEIDDEADIILDDEHTGFSFIRIDEVDSYIQWPEQRRLMKLTHDILTDPTLDILPQWIIKPE